MSQSRDLILHLREMRAKKQADLQPWRPEDVRAFARDYEIDPKTGRDLFKIGCKRLCEIKRLVEISDNSLQNELREGDLEVILRRWIQRKLTERSRGRYTVPQEEEIDRQERPDLRIENPKTDPVSIEVKWANRWSLRQLLERLEIQLVGQYLRAHNSCYGIYLVGTIGSQSRWQDPESGQMVPFEQVIVILRSRAREIASRRTDVEGLEVISIDFRDPKG